MNVLVVDIGGSNVSIFATRQIDFQRFPSRPTLSAEPMVSGVKKLGRYSKRHETSTLPKAMTPTG